MVETLNILFRTLRLQQVSSHVVLQQMMELSQSPNYLIRVALTLGLKEAFMSLELSENTQLLISRASVDKVPNIKLALIEVHSRIHTIRQSSTSSSTRRTRRWRTTWSCSGRCCRGSRETWIRTCEMPQAFWLQYFDHHSILSIMLPGSTNCPSRYLISLTIPSLLALMVCSIFIASIINNTYPNNIMLSFLTLLHCVIQLHIHFGQCARHRSSNNVRLFTQVLFGVDLFHLLRWELNQDGITILIEYVNIMIFLVDLSQ